MKKAEKETPESGKSAQASFEERLSRLEHISEQIRSSEVPLEDAAKLFEEGIRLARGLEKDIGKIERKIEILVADPGETGEKPVLELFPELNEGE